MQACAILSTANHKHSKVSLNEISHSKFERDLTANHIMLNILNLKLKKKKKRNRGSEFEHFSFLPDKKHTSYKTQEIFSVDKTK